MPERTSVAVVRHVIDVVTAGTSVPVEIGFESVDIGGTQGTTLTVHGVTIAQYQPGTRWWDRALECAVDIARDAADALPVGASVRSAEAWRAALDGALAEKKYTPWDGTEPDWENL
jgi:hypothetical protein